jgi:hypothetical protein
MGLGWTSREVCACVVSLVLGGALASACGGQAYSDGPPPFNSGSGGSSSNGARGGAAGTGARTGSGGAPGAGGFSGSSASAGSGVGGSAAVTGGAAGAPARSMGRPCNSPTAFSGGWVSCADGLLQRSDPAACTSRLPRPAPNLTGVPQDLIASLECTSDTDCNAAPNGYCAFEVPVRDLPHCEYGCVNDSECPSGQICLCGADIGRCAETDCVRGGDCPPAFACLQTEDVCGDPVVHCETPFDECRNDGDCSGGLSCAWRGDRRVCRNAAGCEPSD